MIKNISQMEFGKLPSKDLLSNESEVEFKFIEIILHWLGWKHENIKHKHSLEEYNCGIGTKKLLYKPDYVIQNDNNIPLLVLDAKSPSEKLEKYKDQCASYCLHLNGFKETVKYFILSNGFRTVVYDWKGKRKIQELSYADFEERSQKYQLFYKLLSVENLTNSIIHENIEYLYIKKVNKEEAQKVFKACHKYIWNAEKMGVNAAFMEFIKLIFLKLDSDRKIHKKYKYDDGEYSLKVDKKDVLFSTYWIENNTSEMQKNPIKDIQFRSLMEELKKQIKLKKKKPLFDDNETINLKSGTIKGIVSKLERMDLYGIDEDLNGRLFETFLNATMRGNDLGQYFTPRSIVKLGVALADIHVSKNHIDKVLDGSCGTGGFLIEAFSVMKNKILRTGNYTNKEKEHLINEVLSQECIYGVDAAKDPKLARIARINMYLHGDGGSNIYMGDGLSKTMTPDETDTEEIQDEMESMKAKFLPESFDVVITNPPFSMSLSIDNKQEKEILEDYELLSYGTSKRSLRTGVMFIERYEGLLKKGGKLITILDNTILNSQELEYVRDYIREHFIIKAVISLHGDAFQQSKARVKTSLLYLEKKIYEGEQQADAFMTFSTKLGVDDMPITTPQGIINKARKEANDEIEQILKDYHDFENGVDSMWRVHSDRLQGRLDVKYCIPFRGRFTSKWHTDGFGTRKLSELFNEYTDLINPRKDYSSDVFKILTIKYNGSSSIDEERIGEDIEGKGYIVKKGHIVMSRYNAYYGAIGCISDEEDGAFASKSYIVLQPHDFIDGIYAWAVLRSTEIRADLLDSAVGMGRSTVKWEEIKDIEVPYIEDELKRKEYANRVLESWRKEKLARMELQKVKEDLGLIFGTEGDGSTYRFNANKPPK